MNRHFKHKRWFARLLQPDWGRRVLGPHIQQTIRRPWGSRKWRAGACWRVIAPDYNGSGACKCNQMVNFQAHADFFANRMIVVAGHKGHHASAARQLQRVDELGAAKGFGDDPGL